MKHHQFNKEALSLFEEKGYGNAAKVRRIFSLTEKFSQKNISDLKILDLGCGEGVYSLEAAMKGAASVAIDARDNRLKYGKKIAEAHGLDKVVFEVDDVRNVSLEKYGRFDVIYNLGLLYHLDTEDVFSLLKNLYDMCDDLLLIDTSIGLSSPVSFEYEGEKYYGVKYTEHEEGDTEELMHDKRIMASYGNKQSFLPTKNSLVKYLNYLGFNYIMECYSPIEPVKSEARVTLMAFKGDVPDIDSYPWINGLSAKELFKKGYAGTSVPFVLNHEKGFKRKVLKKVQKFLSKRGYEIKSKLDG